MRCGLNGSLSGKLSQLFNLIWIVETILLPLFLSANIFTYKLYKAVNIIKNERH
jgi:hypothetical protein